MEPYFRPAFPEGVPSAPCPPGCVAEPAGVWEGVPREVVYDPARHQVLFLRGEIGPRLADELRVEGFRRMGRDGATQYLVRDRTDTTVARMRRLERRPRPERGLGIA